MSQRQNKMPGLFKIGKIWHIDKRVVGIRICKSTHQTNYKKAEEIYLKWVNEVKDAKLLGQRPKRLFSQAIDYYVENHKKSSIDNDGIMLEKIKGFIGSKYLTEIHMGNLQDLIKTKQKEGLKTATINNYLQVIRHVLNLAASEWIDDFGLTWLETPPKIKFLKITDKRKPYPLSWEEQDVLFRELPEYLKDMALFKVNTGTRTQEVCNLKWEWEVKLTEINESVFIIPGEFVKNREDRVIVLNKLAMKVINKKRGEHKEYVFSNKGNQVKSMNNTAWRKAREKTELNLVRVHDLKHTFGRRLRAAGVSMEDRQDLLGHKSGKITTHYSMVEIETLIEASNKILSNNTKKQPGLTLLRVASGNT
jgi:integrase